MSLAPVDPQGMTLFRLNQPAAIGQVLQELHRYKGNVSLYPRQAPESEAALSSPAGIAMLQALDMDSMQVALEVQGMPQTMPQQLQAVAHMAGGVRVQWQMQGVWESVGDKSWRLSMPWPAEIWQLQRRRHPRWTVPLGQNYSAVFMFGNKRCVLDVEDVSAAGVALRGTRPETAMLFMGRLMPKVVLKVPDGAQIELALKVRSRRSYHSFLLGEQVLVGCSIEAISAQGEEALQQWLSRGHVLPAMSLNG